jgi:transposase
LSWQESPYRSVLCFSSCKYLHHSTTCLCNFERACQLLLEAYWNSAHPCSEQTCHTWFKSFRSGEISLEDQPRSGRPSELENHSLVDLLKEDNWQTTRDLADQLGTSHTTIKNHFHALGYKSKLGAWVPHDFTEPNKWQHLSVSSSLLSRYNRKSFLLRLII